MELLLYTGLIFALLEVTAAKDECYNWYYDESYHCDFGCCGDGWDRGCCSLTGIIVGCIIGGLVLIAIIVTVVCCCMKVKGRSGRTINAAPPTHQPNVMVINPGQPYYIGQPVQPPPYGQFYPPPPPPPPVHPAPASNVPAPAQYPPIAQPNAPPLNQDPAYPMGEAPPEYKRF